MKRVCFALLLCCLLLCGCAAGVSPETSTSPTETQPIERCGYYDPDSALEAQTGGAIRCFSLGDSAGHSVMSIDDQILLFSVTESGTHLTVLSGDMLYPTATAELECLLSADDPSLRRWENGISFFDTQAMETVVLDAELREISRIAVPEDLLGIPLLSTDRRTLYYGTSTAIRALDLETGISRVLRETANSYQAVTGLWLDDAVLECSIAGDDANYKALFLSTETGETLEITSDSMELVTFGENYYAAFLNGSTQSFVFGTAETEPAALMPEDSTEGGYFLPEDQAAVMFFQPSDSEAVLDYYDLETGLRTASLSLSTEFYPWSFDTVADGQVCFLNYDEAYGCDTLYIWDTTLSPSGDNTVYTDTYYTREAPDYEGLAACTLYAQDIGDRYGIEVLVYKDAVKVQPGDYALEYEHLAPVLQKELAQLDARLGNYPEGFLQTLSERFDGVTISLVRSISGSAESGSLDTASGIQFWDGYHAYIALTAGMDTEYSLYHELCHLIDSVVLTESSAYDRWDELNPAGFEYDYDYIANQSRNSGEYLREEKRYFIDMYSMSFPKEDRARIMEYAMTEGNEALFQSSTMQAKLKALCEGIRKAFGLRKSPETFLWEQYLKESLAYTE